MRMAVRRMNELWKTMGLALMFGFLLLHSCQGETTSLTAPPTSSPTATPTASQTTSPTTADPTRSATYSTSGPALEKTTVSSQPATRLNPTTSQSTSVTEQSTTIDPMTNHVKETGKLMTGNNSVPNQSSKITNKDSGSSPAVFVSVLVIGLLLAAITVGIYYFKCHRRNNARGMKLAEESYMADEENQGNTLVSVDPLNQPEPQEKPSLNGESQEAVKAQNPPAATNGHSTTKTADTEL
uniref:Uncharacterized protein n=1 Tax=Cyprinus carpio carpio TaxID=630221 RepID=A0A9J7WYT5_CYPCA